ncbi:MAG: 30S ribosomal protein S8 [Patescibacteria group bacterium]|nr:30S ribosomal protein S8 [Patescibacteria group bacterium]MDE2015568.1 30S ribosomal protein S8 [Patescibacteria group bacterium]MDE2227236.1 30S ribosomal protein S8 [Patescibacteria group bacterium]
MYYDLLAKIKNAESAKKKTMTTSFSKMDFAVAKSLVQGGYLSDAQKKIVGKKNFLEVKLTHSKNSPALSGFKIISKPSRRLYVDYRSLSSVKQGYGLAIISTSKGIMSGKEAKKQKVGGEYLFQIW